MKNLYLTCFSLLSVFAFSQNTPPSIDITSIEEDEVSETLTINFSLDDTNDDNCEVWLKMSLDGGTYFETIASENLNGDVGLDIAPGDTKSLTWDFSNLTEEIESVHIRLFASDNQVVDIADMVSQVDETELLNNMNSIVGVRHFTANPTKLADVRTFITDAFIDADLQTESQDFLFSGTNMENILGRKPGAKEEDITFIIDGHFDGVPGSPAADDNGSAVAGMLEALRILSQYSFEHSIRFIGFDAEELGLIGSQNYVINGIKPFEDIQGVLNFEMIGFYSDAPNSQTLPSGFGVLFPAVAQQVSDDDSRGNFLFAASTINSNPLLTAFTDATDNYVPDLKLLSASLPGNGSIAPDLRRSDHAPFWDAGIEALMLTDSADFRNPNYHTPNDEISTLDFEFMKNVVQATVATLAELAVPISADFDEADLSAVLSIDDHNHLFPYEITLFPNPSNGIISLQVSGAQTGFKSRIEVYDLTGKQLHRDVLEFASGSSTKEIDLQNLANGTYILNLYTGNASKSLSFIITD
jgi:hypothetical protein